MWYLVTVCWQSADTGQEALSPKTHFPSLALSKVLQSPKTQPPSGNQVFTPFHTLTIMRTVLFCFQSALLCSSGWPKPHSPSAASSRVLRLQVCHHIKSRYLKSIHVCACMCLCILVCVCVHAHVCMCTRSCVWHTCGQPGVPVLMLHLV